MSENSLLKQITATYGYTRFWKVDNLADERDGYGASLKSSSQSMKPISSPLPVQSRRHPHCAGCKCPGATGPIPQTAAEVRPSRHAAHDQGGCVNPADPNTCFPTKRHTLRR